MSSSLNVATKSSCKDKKREKSMWRNLAKKNNKFINRYFVVILLLVDVVARRHLEKCRLHDLLFLLLFLFLRSSIYIISFFSIAFYYSFSVRPKTNSETKKRETVKIWEERSEKKNHIKSCNWRQMCRDIETSRC